MKLKITFVVALFYLVIAPSRKVCAQAAPHLETRGKATQLIVDGKPFIVLGGELHNSSSSSLGYLAPIWAPLKKMNLNTALVAVSWELVEPVEGKFDFSLIDGILSGARKNNLKVVLLWFGSWKNGLSHYTPEWVKKDVDRFPRIRLSNGRSTETITALSVNAMQADAKAFAAVMQYVKKADAVQHTVIMVQVENEVGIIGGTRDHSAMADAEFAKPVPAELLNGIQRYRDELQPPFKKLWEGNGSKTSGTWTDVFGKTAAADEAFMAWHYAKYMNTLAKDGKSAYSIPMFVNTWIVQPEDKTPGDYPSGGPQAQVHDIWRIGAPSIDIKCPDVYLPDFKGVTALYAHSWNPLFIPESFSGMNGAANAFYAVGKYSGLGYSPFGIDRLTPAESKPVSKAYNLLAQLTPEIVAAQSKGLITAVSLEKPDSTQTLKLGGYTLTVSLRKNWSGVTLAAKGYCLIYQTGTDAFTVAGSNIDVTFVPDSPGPATAGIASVREGQYVNGTWKPGRVLNGDDIMVSYKLAEEAAQNRTGTGVRIYDEPAIMKVKLYRF